VRISFQLFQPPPSVRLSATTLDRPQSTVDYDKASKFGTESQLQKCPKTEISGSCVDLRPLDVDADVDADAEVDVQNDVQTGGASLSGVQSGIANLIDYV